MGFGDRRAKPFPRAPARSRALGVLGPPHRDVAHRARLRARSMRPALKRRPRVLGVAGIAALRGRKAVTRGLQRLREEVPAISTTARRSAADGEEEIVYELRTLGGRRLRRRTSDFRRTSTAASPPGGRARRGGRTPPSARRAALEPRRRPASVTRDQRIDAAVRAAARCARRSAPYAGALGPRPGAGPTARQRRSAAVGRHGRRARRPIAADARLRDRRRPRRRATPTR